MRLVVTIRVFCVCMLSLLKITTIRRYGGNTTRSKIPIGSFYGHTFILPWEKVSTTPSHMSPGPSADSDRSGNHMSSDQSQILSQLGMYMSLLEDVQCRYSLACKNLITLLSAAEVPGNESSNHTQFFLKKGRRTDDDNKIHLAYCECIQLQVCYDDLFCATSLALSVFLYVFIVKTNLC